MDDVADDDYFQRAMAADEEIDEDLELIEALNERRRAYIFHVRTNFHFESKFLKNLPCFATIFRLRRTIPPPISPQSGGGHVDLRSNCRRYAATTASQSRTLRFRTTSRVPQISRYRRLLHLGQDVLEMRLATLTLSEEIGRADLRLKHLQILEVDFVLFSNLDSRFDIAERRQTSRSGVSGLR